MVPCTEQQRLGLFMLAGCEQALSKVQFRPCNLCRSVCTFDPFGADALQERNRLQVLSGAQLNAGFHFKAV